jgi:protein-tyrosine phosphatase
MELLFSRRAACVDPGRTSGQCLPYYQLLEVCDDACKSVGALTAEFTRQAAKIGAKMRQIVGMVSMVGIVDPCWSCFTPDTCPLSNFAVSTDVGKGNSFDMFRILLVCTANLYRSPLAAALLSQKLRADGQSIEWTVESAGTWTHPGQSVPSNLLESANRLAIDLAGHSTRLVDGSLLADSDLVLVMEKGQKEALCVEFPSVRKKVHLLSEAADSWEYDITDPILSDMDMDEFVAGMSRLIDRAYPTICKLLRTCAMLEFYGSS